MGPGDAGLVHEDFDLATHQGVTAGCGDAVLELGELEKSLGDQRVLDDTVEVGRVRALLTREGEEPGPVELGLFDEPEQQVVVVLGLTWIADDEVSRHRHFGAAFAQVRELVEILFARVLA